MFALMKGGGLTTEDVAKNLCFRADGAFVFQGGKTRVIKQIKETWAPFSMGVYCVAHRINLSVQYSSNLIFIAHIEALMVNLFNYFNHSAKQHLEFQKLVTIMETKVNKIIKNVRCQCWNPRTKLWLNIGHYLEACKLILILSK
jgi:hypothetical protein